MSSSHKNPVDRLGQRLRRGDTVKVISIPDGLTKGLPSADRDAVQECIGKAFPIRGFNSLGEAEIEFSSGEDDSHTIWVAPNCLERQKGENS